MRRTSPSLTSPAVVAARHPVAVGACCIGLKHVSTHVRSRQMPRPHSNNLAVEAEGRRTVTTPRALVQATVVAEGNRTRAATGASGHIGTRFGHSSCNSACMRQASTLAPALLDSVLVGLRTYGPFPVASRQPSKTTPNPSAKLNW